jgi:hypothetical protein
MPSAAAPDTTITRDLPMQIRAAEIVPGSYSEAEGTIDVLWTTGAQGRRVETDALGNEFHYDEELSLHPSHVDMGRFDRGVVQVIDAHHVKRGVSAVIGIATRGWIEGGAGYARLKLSVDPDHAGIVANIRAGVLRAISFGYWVSEYLYIAPEDRTDGGLLPLLRAVRWEVYELSFVPVGFDRDAMSLTRSALPDSIANLITRSADAGRHHQEQSMPQPSGDNTADNTPTPSTADPIAAERTRSAEITVLCRDAGVADQAEAMIREGLTIEAAGLRILRARAADDRSSGGHINVTTVRDEFETKLRGIEEALTTRIDPRAKLTDLGRQYRGMSLVELGTDLLESCGVKTRGMARSERVGHIARMRGAPGYMHTTDFGSVLGGLGARRLAASYNSTRATYKLWARRAPNAPDLRDIQIVELSSGPELSDVNQAGEYRYGAYTDSGKSYRISKGGKIVALTEEMLINDDLRAFDRIISDFGAAAGRRENRMVYACLTGASVMSDNKLLFAAEHNNIKTGAGSALTLDALRAARTAMRKQTGSAAANETGLPLNISPRFLLVSSDLETEGGILTSANYQPTTRQDANEFANGQRNALELIVEPLLDAAPTAWYMAADSSEIDTIEYCYLDGQEGPVIEQKAGWETDGFEFKCKHRFAAAAVNWRGLVKSTGA